MLFGFQNCLIHYYSMLSHHLWDETLAVDILSDIENITVSELDAHGA